MNQKFLTMNWALQRIDKCKQQPVLQIFTIYLRYLIGAGFVIAAFGMGKFSGQELLISAPGQSIEKLEPLQQFFKVMATSGLYWNFIGITQVIAGGLLMTQRFAKLGAVIFFPLILNIFVITISYNFKGTPVVTGLMLLATIFLLMWDLDSLQFIFRTARSDNFFKSSVLSVMIHPLWTATGVIMLIMIITMALLKVSVLVHFVSAFVIGLLAFLIYIIFLRRSMQTATLEAYS
jgi:hypothetical protein